MSQIMKVLSAASGVDLGKLDDILANYQGNQEELVNILHGVQNEYSYLPKEALEKVSEFLTIPMSTVYRISSSYQAFSLEPRRKHIVKVCDGVACHLNNSAETYKTLDKTSNGRFTLEKVRCIGCCGKEPMVMVDEECGNSIWAEDKISKF